MGTILFTHNFSNQNQILDIISTEKIQGHTILHMLLHLDTASHLFAYFWEHQVSSLFYWELLSDFRSYVFEFLKKVHVYISIMHFIHFILIALKYAQWIHWISSFVIRYLLLCNSYSVIRTMSFVIVTQVNILLY